jgi:hypothetical protein
LNEVNRDVEGLRAYVQDTSAFPAPELGSKRQALALETETIMQKYGLNTGAPPTGKVVLSIQRGVHATPNQPMLVKSMKASHEPVQEWQGGFVTVWNEWELERLREPGHKVEILYWRASYLLDDFSRLTAAQRAVKFGRLQKAPKAKALADYLADQHLGLALDLFNLAPLIAKAEPALSKHVAEQAAVEIEALRMALAARPTWGVGESEEAAGLFALAEKGAADFRFWQGWAAVSRWVDEAPDIDKVTDAKVAAVENLKRAKP